jgi:hypothetical protein
MAQGGHYAELYDTYFRHQSPDYRPPPEAADAAHVSEREALKAAVAPLAAGS